MRAGAIAALLFAACSAGPGPADPHPYHCNRDAGDPSQCPGGWSCGKDDVCYDRSVAGAIACDSDLDCRPGWRCTFNQRCVDPTPEKLSQPPFSGQLDASVLTRWVLAPPSLVDATPGWQQSVALADDGGVWLVVQLSLDGGSVVPEAFGAAIASPIALLQNGGSVLAIDSLHVLHELKLVSGQLAEITSTPVGSTFLRAWYGRPGQFLAWAQPAHRAEYGASVERDRRPSAGRRRRADPRRSHRAFFRTSTAPRWAAPLCRPTTDWRS